MPPIDIYGPPLGHSLGIQAHSETGRALARYTQLMAVIRRAREELTYFSHPACAPAAKPLLDEWGWACRELVAMNGGKPILHAVSA